MLGGEGSGGGGGKLRQVNLGAVVVGGGSGKRGRWGRGQTGRGGDGGGRGGEGGRREGGTECVVRGARGDGRGVTDKSPNR